jgi:hypothetical protein
MTDRADAAHSLFISATSRPSHQSQVSIPTNRHSMAVQEDALPQEIAITGTC